MTTMNELLARSRYIRAGVRMIDPRRDLGLIGVFPDSALFNGATFTRTAPPAIQSSAHAPGILRATPYDIRRFGDPQWYPAVKTWR